MVDRQGQGQWQGCKGMVLNDMENCKIVSLLTCSKSKTERVVAATEKNTYSLH